MSHLTHSNAIVSVCIDLNAVMFLTVNTAYLMLHNCTRVCACVYACVYACVHVCMHACKVTCGYSVNGLTLEKWTCERYNFASTLGIEMKPSEALT